MLPLARRLTALLTLLSVLLASLGRVHVTCGPDGARGAGGVAAVTAPAEHHHGDSAPARHCGADVAVVDDCGSVAHCAAWVPVPDVVATLDAPAAVGVRVAFAARAPLGPDAEPRFPPPKA